MITIDPPSSSLPQQPALSKASLTRFLNRARIAAGLVGTVSVLLTSDSELRRLNRTFRGKNRPTDVLSFPAELIPGLPPKLRHAGDLAISLDTAVRQAAEHGHTLPIELRVLLLHGLLHLAGLDHETDSGVMAARELELRATLRLPSSLIDRVSQPDRPHPADPAGARRRGVIRLATPELQPAKRKLTSSPAPRKKSQPASRQKRSRA